MGAVLDDVVGRHGGIAETVDVDGLELALQEMHGQELADEKLKAGSFGQLVEVVVDQWSQRVEEQDGDEQRPEVLDDKHSAPADLRACTVAIEALVSLFRLLSSNIAGCQLRPHTKVLDMDDTLVLQSQIIDDGVARIGHDAAIASLGNSHAMNGAARGLRERVVDPGR